MANSNLKEFIKVISENFELGEFDLETIPDIKLPENFNNNFHKNFLTPLAAKNNEEIRGHFKGQYLSTVDSRTKASFLASGGSEESFAELKATEPDSMKLIDLVLSEAVKLNSKPDAASGDKAHEAYKIQTAKQIGELLKESEGFEQKMADAISAKNGEWNAKLQTATIESKFAGKTFNEAIGREDAIMLTMNKIQKSPYLLRLDENLVEKVYDKANPENLAVIDGKDVTWDIVVDKYAYDYTKKNNQAPTERPEARVVDAPTGATVSAEEGRWIVGHPNYGK